MKILVAEDFPINQHVISIMLSNLGHTFSIAENGQVAIDLLLKNEYNLVLMDLQMPVVDGIECIKFIRNHESQNNLPRIPIVALTAQVFDNEETFCKEIGTDGFLSKPVKLDILKAVLDKFV